MITGPRKHFEGRCRNRGYTLDEVRACIVSEDGDTITVDVDHPAYPRVPKPGFAPPHASQPRGVQATSGPGTELKKLLATVGIKASPNCSCNARAKLMDQRGCDWVEANVDTVVGWLREEATKRGLPFIDAAGRLLVKRAIRNARRAAAS